MKEILQKKIKELELVEKKVHELDKAFTNFKNDYITKREELVATFHKLTGSIETLKELTNGERKEDTKQVKGAND